MEPEEQSCFRCALREGSFCEAKDEFLTLINVEENMLIFQDQFGCPAYMDRRKL